MIGSFNCNLPDTQGINLTWQSKIGIDHFLNEPTENAIMDNLQSIRTA